MRAKNYEIINPGAPKRRIASEINCQEYGDAPVCELGDSDVDCTGERYRGCQPGSQDCANDPTNPDDNCCWGWGPTPGDNIDHQWCSTNDADWGGTCFLFDGGNTPPTEENQE